MFVRTIAVLVVAGGCGRLGYDPLELDGAIARDAGLERDAGIERDAGVDRDGGDTERDAGIPPDGGERDAGIEPDGGTPPVGGCVPWQPGFRFDVVGPITELNGPDLDSEPSLSLDGLTLRFTSTRDGVGSSVFSADRASVDAPFGAPVLVAWASSSVTDGPLWVRADGLEAIVSSNRSGGLGGFDLWGATRAAIDQPFVVANLGGVNSALNEWDPFVTSDGLELWLSRRDLPSTTTTEILRSVRADSSVAFGAPAVVPELAVATASEGNATLDETRTTVVFMSDRPGGIGAMDIWYAMRAAPTEPFGTPALLPSVSSIGRDWDPHLRADGCELVFVRGEDPVDWELYRAIYVAP